MLRRLPVRWDVYLSCWRRISLKDVIPVEEGAEHASSFGGFGSFLNTDLDGNLARPRQMRAAPNARYLIHPALTRAFKMIASQSSRDTVLGSRMPACLIVFPFLDSLQPARSSVAQSARSSMDFMPCSPKVTSICVVIPGISLRLSSTPSAFRFASKLASGDERRGAVVAIKAVCGRSAVIGSPDRGVCEYAAIRPPMRLRIDFMGPNFSCIGRTNRPRSGHPIEGGHWQIV
jgi:hypothetical protein